MLNVTHCNQNDTHIQQLTASVSTKICNQKLPAKACFSRKATRTQNIEIYYSNRTKQKYLKIYQHICDAAQICPIVSVFFWKTESCVYSNESRTRQTLAVRIHGNDGRSIGDGVPWPLTQMEWVFYWFVYVQRATIKTRRSSVWWCMGDAISLPHGNITIGIK